MTKQRETDESRPPLYNAEDYIAALKRFSRLTGLQMYLGNNDANGSYDGGGNAEKSDEKGGGKSAKSAKNDASAASKASAATGLVLQNLRWKNYGFVNL